jgi:hypothetical protein
MRSDNSIVREALMGKKVLGDIFHGVVVNRETSHSVISRVAWLMELFVLESFEQCSADFYWITDLVLWLNVPQVVEFFATVDHSNRGSEFRIWLVTLGVHKVLLEGLEYMQTSAGPIDPEFIAGYYELLDILLIHSDVLVEWISCGFSLLVTPMQEMPPFVRTKHLKLLIDICNAETASFFLDQVDTYIETISVVTTIVNSDFISTLHILTKLMQFVQIDGEPIVAAAFDVLMSCPEHTIALNAAIGVLMALVQIEEFRDQILDRFVLIAQHNFQISRNRNRILTIYCYQMMLQLESIVNWDGYDRSDFDDVYATHVLPLHSQIELEYGGPVIEITDYREYI